LLAIPRDETVELFDGRTGAASNAALDTPSPLRSVALSPDERWLATGHADNRVRVWNLATRALAVDHRFDDIFDAALDVNAVAFAPDGGRLAASTGEIAYLDVLEVPSGTVLRHFGWSGGHFGEPFELRWSRDGARLWFPFVCGSMPCDEMVFDARAACPKWRGRSPRVSRAGIGIATTLGGVLALDTGSLRCLWYRPILGRDGELVQTPAGYFTATVAQLDGLAIHADTIGGSPSPSLLDVAADSFDPKRVRASCAGVRLSLPRF
jgi:hypothetical protein